MEAVVGGGGEEIKGREGSRTEGCPTRQDDAESRPRGMLSVRRRRMRVATDEAKSHLPGPRVPSYEYILRDSTSCSPLMARVC